MNKTVTHEQAVASAKDFLEHRYPAAKNADKTLGSLIAAFPKGVIPEFEPDGALRRISLVPDNSDGIRNLLSEARVSADAYDAVIAWASAHLFNNGTIPDENVQKFISSHLLGAKKRPSKLGRKGAETGYKCRHALLRLAVSQVESMGFLLTRGENPENRDNACEIVAEAMAALRFTPQSLDHIERIIRLGDRAGFS
jgi:hypothetical protein